MDLEKAYNKIDNLCLTNYNSATVINMDITKGRMPEKIDFFKGYNETQDDDFCKDEEEMVEALETFKKVVDLQKELGCPLDVLAKLMLNGFYYEYPEYDDDDEPTGKMELIYDNFIGMTYLVRGTDKNIYIDTRYLDEPLKLSDYKKTWWLKEDKSE